MKSINLRASHLEGNLLPYSIKMSLLRGQLFPKKDWYTFLSCDEKYHINVDFSKLPVHKPEWGFQFETENEMRNCYKYLKLKVIRFILSCNRIGFNLAPFMINLLPKVDFNEEWTERKLANYLNLTEDELQFIFKAVPDYYEEDRYIK